MIADLGADYTEISSLRNILRRNSVYVRIARYYAYLVSYGRNVNSAMHQTINTRDTPGGSRVRDVRARARARGWASRREKRAATLVYVFSFRRKCCFRNRPFCMTFTVRQTCRGPSPRDTYTRAMINGRTVIVFYTRRVANPPAVAATIKRSIRKTGRLCTGGPLRNCLRFRAEMRVLRSPVTISSMFSDGSPLHRGSERKKERTSKCVFYYWIVR